MSVTGLGRIATAEKMSVDQLREALQNKTLPAYIAVPLIEEKLDMNSRMKSMMAMQQAQQPQMPIADRVMQRADMESGISALPSNLAPAQGMAGGGIIAFADGGDAEEDDDDEDDDEISYGATRMDKENEALLMQLLASSRAVPGMGAGTLGTGIVPPAEMPARASTVGKDLGIEALAPGASTPAITLSSAKEERSTGIKVPSGHKYESKIVSKAEDMGIDPKFALYLAGKETGGLKNPETARSRAGAMGIMQLMPGTAKDMGVKDPFDPEQNIEGGLRYAKLMMDKYKDPKLAAIAYNWGPGNTDKWLRAGADPDKLPKETRNYVASLKEGGAIRFQNEGLVDPLFSADTGASGVMPRSELVEMMTLKQLQEYNRTGVIPPEIRKKIGDKGVGGVPMFGKGAYDTDKKAIPSTLAQTATPESRVLQSQYEAQDMQEGDLGRLSTPASAALTAAAQGAAEEKAAAPSFADKLEALLSKREAGITAQRQQDKYMAMLAAGLGMMGGRSRYAAENIGQGALQGVAAMQASNKLRAAEENALLSGRLGQYRIGQGEALRTQLAGEAQQTRLTQQLSAAKTRMMNEIIKAKKMDPLASMQDPNIVASVAAQADAMLAKDPGYQSIYKKIYGMDFTPERMAVAPVDTVKKYGLTPKNQ